MCNVAVDGGAFQAASWDALRQTSCARPSLSVSPSQPPFILSTVKFQGPTHARDEPSGPAWDPAHNLHDIKVRKEMPMDSARLFSRKDYLIFLLILAGFVWVFVALPPLALHSNVEGARYVQMRNFSLYGSLPIHYPGLSLGLQYEDVIKQQGIFVQRAEKLYCLYPPLFTYLSSLFYPLLGDRVTNFLPLLAFFLSVLVLAGALRLLLRDKPVYYVLLFGFLLASPIFMYALCFWEGVPAIFCVVCSLYFLVRYFLRGPSVSNLCLSAAIMSAGIFFQPEVILLAICYTGYLSLALCTQKQIKKTCAVLACSAAPIVLYVLFNYRFYGSSLLLHLLYNSLGFHLSIPQVAFALGTLLLCIALTLLTRKGKGAPATKQRIYAFLPVLFIPFVILFSAFSLASSLLLAFPLVLLFFFAISERIENLLSESMSLGNILFVTTAGFLFLLYCFFAGNPETAILAWLPAVPLTIIFIALEEKTIASARPMVALVITLLIFSAGYQAYTLKTRIWNYKQYNAERIQFLRTATKAGDVIICDSQPLMEHGGPLFFERIFVVARNPRELSQSVQLLKDGGVTRAYLWTTSYGSCARPSTSNAATNPVVFSSSHGPRNYLMTLSPGL
jgi:hypothetical protein